MWLVIRIRAVKPRLLSMPGLPKPSSQNCLLLTPTQFVTTSRASSKGKDFILCVGFLLMTLVPALRMCTRNMRSSSVELVKVFKETRMTHRVVKKLFRSILWVTVLVSRPLCMQSTYGVRRYIFIYLAICLIYQISRGNRGGVSVLPHPSPHLGLPSECHSNCHYHSSWSAGFKDGLAPAAR